MTEYYYGIMQYWTFFSGRSIYKIIYTTKRIDNLAETLYKSMKKFISKKDITEYEYYLVFRTINVDPNFYSYDQIVSSNLLYTKIILSRTNTIIKIDYDSNSFFSKIMDVHDRLKTYVNFSTLILNTPKKDLKQLCKEKNISYNFFNNKSKIVYKICKDYFLKNN